jgi:hypothetical protein
MLTHIQAHQGIAFLRLIQRCNSFPRAAELDLPGARVIEYEYEILIEDISATKKKKWGRYDADMSGVEN